MRLTAYIKRLLRTRNKIKAANSHMDDYIRITVHKSRKNLYIQFLYITNFTNGKFCNGKVLLSCSTLEEGFDRNKNNANKQTAKILSEKAISKLKTSVEDFQDYKFVFDKGAYPYHGVVKEICEVLRDNLKPLGVEF